MSRNASGAYTLPTGNPVVTATTITSTWANNTLADIATELTDSLSRSGKGAMTAALRGIDGTVGSPGLSFASEATSGFYRESAGVMSVSILGVKVASFAAGGTTTDKLQVAAGTAAAPTLTFTGDTNTGLYAAAADVIGVSTGGSERMRVNSNGLKVGTTSDAGSTSNAVPIVAGMFQSFYGSGTVLNNATTTVGTLPNVTNGVWLISAWIPANDVSNYSCNVLVLTQGTGHQLIQNRMGALMLLTVSSLNIDVYQNSGATQTVSYSVTRLA